MGKSVRDFLQARVGAGLTSRPSNPSVGTTTTQLLKQVPARVAFLVVNLGAFVVFIAPQVAGAPSSLNGVRLEANGGSATAQWDEDGEVTAWEWQAIAIGGASTVFILETVIERASAEAGA